MKLIDLHIHSTFSDGKLTIPEVIDFYGSRGFKIIAITDHLCEEKSFLGKASRVLKKTLTRENFHNYLLTIQLEGQRALKQYGMLVIPGIEITKNYISFKRSAHIVALGVSEYIAADDSVLDIISQIKAQGALAIAAHPVSTQMIGHQTYHLWDLREQLKDKFDAWEVASGPHIFEQVKLSGLPMIANSDFHHPGHIRSWKTLVKCDLNFDALKVAIREQQIEFMFYEEPVEARINTFTTDLGFYKNV
jgi:PHP family Zn ribbon phosphoesterase